MLSKIALPLLSLGLVEAHYSFPWINVNGVNSTYWQYTRQTNNYNALSPVTDVTSSDLRCYDSAVSSSPATYSIAAGSTVSIGADPGGVCCGQYHPGVSQVYMAQVPSGTNAATWEPTNAVWFKVGEVPPITDGGTSIVWQAQNAQYVTFTIPKATPSGTYLVRVENIALHSATAKGGAQFYISCSLFTVTGGGNGTPGPLVAIPGVYTGNEPGILINIYYPIPATYTMPGPAIWTGGASSGSTTGGGGTTGTPTTVRTTTTTTTTTTKTATGPTQTAYGQCGGTGWTGATTCVAGYKCSATNTYYSQCVPN